MIITIGRQHGSNGHLIAGGLAERLGYRCLDKEIVDRAAEDSNFNKAILASYDEKRISPYFSGSLQYMGGMGEGFRLSTQIAAAQFDAIRSLADEGNCIFVGRCADYVLRNRKDLLRVFIMAPQEYRIRTMMERRQLDEEQARRLIKQVDKDRSSYYKYYTDQIWSEINNYDLCINSAVTGVEGAVSAIEGVVRTLEKK
jgi:cytidylate kinase